RARAPAKGRLSLRPHRALKFLLASEARGMLARQENHSDAVFAWRREGDALPAKVIAIKRVRNLYQDAGTVAAQRISTDRAPVIQVVQDQERLLHQRVARPALDVCTETNPTG